MKSLPKEKRDRLILIGMGTVIAVAALYFVLIKAQQNSADALGKQIKEQKLKLSNGERLVASAGELKKNLGVASQKLTATAFWARASAVSEWVRDPVNRQMTMMLARPSTPEESAQPMRM